MRSSPGPRNSVAFPPSLLVAALAQLGVAACYDSQPTPLDGDHPDVPDARDARDDASSDDAGEVTGVRFDPDFEDPALHALWLAEESATGSSITLRLMVDGGPRPVFGVAARLRWDGALVALRDVRSCGPFDAGGPALLEWKLLEPEPEAWLGLAARSRDSLVDAAGGACALLAVFDILGPGSSRIELVGERSAAVGSVAGGTPPTRYVTDRVGGGTLEVTR